MIRKNKKFKIDETDIFKNDKLERKSAIENLSSLVMNTNEAFTMSINADWGAGKTTFIKFWQTYLEKKHSLNSIYFSAWEDDFSKEPLISILGEINKYIDTNFQNEKTIVGKVNKVKDIGVQVIKRGVPAFVNGMTGGLLDYDKGVEKALGAISEEVAKGLIENYSKDKEITEQFKASLKKLLEHINEDKPFVIFIDELDRCRPLYSIELLERIKHIFGIDGLIFVLSIDKKQLSESIKSQYGNIDTNSYLKRFIDLEYNLENPSKDKFCDFLYKEYEIEKTIISKEIDYQSDRIEHLDMMKYLVKSLDLTLREIEQAFIQIAIVFKTIPPKLFRVYLRVFILFIILKIKRPKLYSNLILKKQPKEEIINEIILLDVKKNTASNHYLSHDYLGVVIKSIIYATSITDDELNNFITHENKKPETMLLGSKEYKEQNGLIHSLRSSHDDLLNLNELIDNAIKKIDFLDRFNIE